MNAKNITESKRSVPLTLRMFVSLSVTELQLSRQARRRHLLLSGMLRSPRQPARALLQALSCQPPQQRGGDASVPDVSSTHQHARVRRGGAGVHRGGGDQVRTNTPSERENHQNQQKQFIVYLNVNKAY